MALVTHYIRNLAVPVRRDPPAPAVLDGEATFHCVGCAACHRPKLPVPDQAEGGAGNQGRIRPYTDLLLHDMGTGLADGRPEGDADGQEWRTPPLWGIGILPGVSGQAAYLHDGRAKGLLEAILWHDGEARARRESWRSRRSLANVCTNLRALEHLYATGFAPRLGTAPETVGIDHGLALTSATAVSACLSQPGTLLDESQAPDQRKALEDLGDLAFALQARTGRGLAEALDLMLGFNSLDGD